MPPARLPLAAFALVLAAVPFAASAAEDPPLLTQPPFVDDRSTPESLVRSLYSAVNRREYARAWDYFSVPPAKSFDAFVAGYAETRLVDVAVGRPAAEGAAGSVYYRLPVAIRAIDAAGEEKVYAGCYTLRQVNPAIQEPPFRPMAIEKGSVRPVDGFAALAASLPEACDGVKAEAETPDELKARAVALFRAMHGGDCDRADNQTPFLANEEPQAFDLEFRASYETAADPPRKATLFRFTCAYYAYNQSEAYFLADDYGQISPVAFAEPDLDIVYADEEGTRVKSLTVAGFTTQALLINSDFDPASLTITSFSKWRGVGDAFSTGSWVFRNGQFVLTAYAADVTYDGEQDPKDILAYPAPK